MAEIKISDLSIGDWVYQKMDDGAYQVQWVEREMVGLIKHTGTEEDGSIRLTAVPLSFIEPIPLTPEILEKNGFTRWERGSNKGDYYLDIPRTKRVWLYYDFGVYKMAYIRNTRGCETFFKCRDIASVHQLQHALRLAGVEKEIEL